MFLKRISRSAQLAAATSLWLAATAAGGDEAAEAFPVVGSSDAMTLESSDCGSACVIIFGTVGEPFGVSMETTGRAAQVEYERGLNALGEACALPEGLEFDPESLSLSGIPQRPGFHEFVLLATEKGRTRERVVLIDIQPAAASRMADAYASYFFGGIR